MNKLKTLPQLKKIVAAARRKGESVVLGNGCFDLIHLGHIRYLRDSRRKGDLLIVALNSDSSVRRLKGRGRPILDQKERAEILASFSFVDFLTIFRELNVQKILYALKPDIHVKGSDYTPDTVPEKDAVRAVGGRVAIAGGPKVRATRDVIRQIARLAEGRAGKEGC